jgi:hypothetical protein
MRWRSLVPIPLVLATVALAVLQCGGWDGTVNGDGVSYLDLAAQYARGDLGALANGYWSPLYPMLLGAALRLAGIAGPTTAPQLLTPEMRVVFAVNVAVMAMAALAFARLLRVLHRASPEPSRAIIACRALAASALFVWCAIRFVGTTSVTPDALLAIWLMLLASELVGAVSSAPSRARTVRVAVLLAAGYWTKAVFFPVALVVLPVYLLMTLRAAAVPAERRAHVTRGLVAALVLMAPLVIVQSVTQQRLSFGETGRLNYRWYVLGAPHAPTLAPDGATQKTTPATLALATAPGTLLFRGDVAGSFPYWYDPSRFEPREPLAFSARAQWTQLAYNAHWYRVVATPFVLLALVAFAASRARARPDASMLVVALPAAALSALYALTHVEGRLAFPPVLVLLVLLLYPISSRRRNTTAPARDRAGAPAWRRVCTAVECTALGALAVLAAGRTAKRVPTAATAATASPATHRAGPASELRASGVIAGSRIGIVGSPYGHYWAHEGSLRLTVVTTTDGRSTPVNDAQLDAIASESCTRGAPLAAIVGERPADVQSPRAIRSTSGWWIWRPSSPCHTARAL